MREKLAQTIRKKREGGGEKLRKKGKNVSGDWF